MWQDQENHLLVIAIDFGTTFSGYAFSFKSAKDEIKMNKSWGAEVGFQAYKTPTTLLIRPNGSLKSFGFQAENDFAEMDKDEIDEGYHLYQRFKMKLYENERLDSKVQISSTSGHSTAALNIFSKALAFMKKHCLEAISRSVARTPANEYIRWVITVPAIWNDTAKKFMRLAAVKAELVSSMASSNLIIALEPEAASLYCRTLAMEKFVGMDHVKGKVALKPRDKYMVIDCGGGTIDITIHGVLANGKVEEIEAASGGPWGGTCVDRKYSNLLEDVFGKPFINHIKKEHPSQWLSMLVDFETKKRSANPANASGINLTVSMSFAKEYEKHSGQDFESVVKEKKQLGVKFQNGMLRISGETLNAFYSEVQAEMTRHLGKLFLRSNVKDVSVIFVVGGFAESSHIQAFLCEEFGRNRRVLIPEEAGMCVMKGAVMFGHNTSSITSRVARFNYGVRTNRSYRDGEDDPSRMKEVEGVGKKVSCIKRFIDRGQRVNIEEIVEHVLHPLRQLQVSVGFPLYSLEDDDTDDPNHETAKCLEKITVQSPNVEKGKGRNIKVSMKFGGTDILFKAVDEESGNEAASTISL